MSDQPVTANPDVVQMLTDFLRENHLSAGDRLPGIRELSQRWGIGRNAVRDGLVRAQMMGLIRLENRSGAYVEEANFNSLSEPLARMLETALIHENSNLFDLIEARRVIETEIAKSAAIRCRIEDLMPLHENLLEVSRQKNDRNRFIQLDEQFHLGIAAVAGNKVLLTLLRSLLILLRPFRMTLVPDEDKWATITSTHQRIYLRLLERDAAGAQQAMEEHLSDHRDLALAQMRTLP